MLPVAMTTTTDIKRQLEAAYRAIEALDADLAAGALSADDHARQRSDRERDAGRLFVALRRAQHARADQTPRVREAVDADVPARSWLRHPGMLAVSGVVLLAAGIGGGVAVARWLEPEPVRAGAPGGAGAPGRAGAPGVAPADSSAVLGAIDREALRQAASRPEAPVTAVLQFAHALLDENRLDEARREYERALSREPRSAEAITHLGAVLYREGKADAALAKVDEALRIDPRYVHAHWDRTQYLFHGTRDFAGAIKAAEAFIAVAGPGPDSDTMRKLIADAREQVKKP